eukprot:13458942-Alexandrium_andersonii.AAC.1
MPRRVYRPAGQGDGDTDVDCDYVTILAVVVTRLPVTILAMPSALLPLSLLCWWWRRPPGTH